mmetsp:Transcript_44658/g.142347  ORF Transcript_44658/g.142347 Transcript_44658/m.142347 type:complete len:229 (+) Transcript_44658:843-1529(+)
MSRSWKPWLTPSHTIHRKCFSPKKATSHSRNLPSTAHLTATCSAAPTRGSAALPRKARAQAPAGASPQRKARTGRASRNPSKGSSSAATQRPTLKAVQTRADARRRSAWACRAALAAAVLPLFLRKTALPPLLPVWMVSGGKYWPGAASVFVPRMAPWPTVTPGQSTQLSRTLAPLQISTGRRHASSSQKMPTPEPKTTKSPTVRRSGVAQSTRSMLTRRPILAPRAT